MGLKNMNKETQMYGLFTKVKRSLQRACDVECFPDKQPLLQQMFENSRNIFMHRAEKI